MINLHHLRYFYVCARSGSMTRAAVELGISQPSLSMQIKQFETSIGLQAFVRSGRSLTLTPKGRELFNYSARFFEMTSDLERFVKSQEVRSELDLRLGVSEDVERPFAADAMGKLLKAHHGKKISAKILSKPNPDLLPQLLSGELDLLLTNQKLKTAKLIGEFAIPVVLVTSLPLPVPSAQNKLNAQSLCERLGQSLLMPVESMTLGQETRHFLKQKQMRLAVGLESNILACLVRAVEEGIGVAFMPLAYVKDQSRRGSLNYIAPKDGYWQHRLYLYSDKTRAISYGEDLVTIIKDLSAML